MTVGRETRLLPVGPVTVEDNGYAITRVAFGQSDGPAAPSRLTGRAFEQLEAYFAGQLRDFDLPLEPRGTPFQRRVWAALQAIPYGETRSYKHIAAFIGCPGGTRAVGMANNRNPIAIVIPCHRVIGANGDLVGYGGGLEVKEALLKLEGAL
ncbi:MAG: methylated-DNA--[Clostridia bacterium]|nr:methylated-DNA--[protein]-cysteine S-methyltransferase [Clostridia bacterium]